MAEQVSSISTARASIERLRSRLASMREEAKTAAKTGTTAVITIGGGVAAGAIASKMPYLPGTQVPTAGAIGAALITAAMTGMLDEHGEQVSAFGAGMLAAIAARETEKVLAAA